MPDSPAPPTEAPLTRREREVMDVILALGEATASEVRERMADPPTNAAVRSVLRILREKGHVVYEQEGPRYVYSAAAPQNAKRSALRHVLRTFFGGSVEGAVAALIELEGDGLSPEESARIREMIDQAVKEGR